jgi:hypothetical protein
LDLIGEAFVCRCNLPVERVLSLAGESGCGQSVQLCWGEAAMAGTSDVGLEGALVDGRWLGGEYFRVVSDEAEEENAGRPAECRKGLGPPVRGSESFRGRIGLR